MNDDLQFTDEAELNRYLFYSDINEINFFVEDKNKEYEYETIFERLFNGKYKIASIIVANGKQGVKEAFKEFGETTNDKKNNIYIVDGDFDRYIRKDKMIINDHFIYLEAYNIENYFIDEKAVITFAKGKLHVIDKKVKQIINFDHWKNNIIEQAKKLFLLYCAVQNVLPTEQNVSRNEYLFLDSKTGFEQKDGYNKYYDEIIKKKSDIDSDIEKIKGLYELENGNNYFNLICGKFLLTSLFIYLAGKLKENFRKNDLRWTLICNFDVSKLTFLKNKIDSIFAS